MQATVDARARPLGGFSLLALGVNGIIGVGIFFAPAEVGRLIGGERGVLVYLVTALTLLPIAWAYGALGSRFSIDGGPYVWARAAFGGTFAFFVGWVTYVSALFSTAAVVSGLGHHAAPALGIEGPIAQRLLALACAVALAAVAASGLRPSAIAWTSVTVLKLLPLVALLLLGVTASFQAPQERAPLVVASFERAVLVVVFALQGFEIVPVVAGSVRRSESRVPAATVGSLIIAATLYCALHWVCVSALPRLGASSTPLVDAAGAIGGAAAAAVVAFGANLSALGIAFGQFVLTPRYLAALADDSALGSWIGEEDARRVPQRALWLTALGVVPLVAVGDLGELFVLSSVAVLAQYSVSVAALAALALRGRYGLDRRHLWPLPLTVVGVVLAARGASLAELGVAAGVLFLGAVVLFVRRVR